MTANTLPPRSPRGDGAGAPAPSLASTQPPPALAGEIQAFIKEGIDLRSGRLAPASDPFWKGLRDLGTELWLDTGDLTGAEKLWTKEFSALTTNNTLLNAEVQKGIYDDLIAGAARVLAGADPRTRVVEIAFILNARHGLRLAQHFGGKVSVELHTDLAHDLDGTVAYGKRYHAVCPDHFIVKVPLTPSGLIATRALREHGIPVNFTLGFSARQNYIATAFARPNYVNVFLGRINSYVADNQLGDGKMAGEKATLASQLHVAELSRARGSAPTLQIAASMRGASQVADLAGVDVFTMPLKVAESARKDLDGKWRSRRSEDYRTALAGGVAPGDVRLETCWEVSAAERGFVASLNVRKPRTAAELVRMAADAGARDLFPELSPADHERIARDGKVPRHEAWRERVRKGDLAVDTLLNLAGLASFSADQKELDDRIRRLVG